MTARVVNPVHETFYEGETRDDCWNWIMEFATSINKPAVQTGETTYKVGDFNLYIFEEEAKPCIKS